MLLSKKKIAMLRKALEDAKKELKKYTNTPLQIPDKPGDCLISMPIFTFVASGHGCEDMTASIHTTSNSKVLEQTLIKFIAWFHFPRTHRRLLQLPCQRTQ